MPKILRQYDVDLVELFCGDGAVLFSPRLQGRIFCLLGGDLVHRLDRDALEGLGGADALTFVNFGGNSLWPAPEGGDYAFFYPPYGGDWRVQDGIGVAKSTVLSRSAVGLSAEREISLVNRRGRELRLRLRRSLEVFEPPAWLRQAGEAVCYAGEDAFIPLGEYGLDDFLIAPWSLEQFPLSSDCVAFGKTAWPRQAVHFDYYGKPRAALRCGESSFAIDLSDSDKWQLGVSAAGGPSLVGVLDRERGFLAMRFSWREDGLYFNIADNDQPAGPFSASDQMSIFHGGGLGFFELELIGAMRCLRRRLGISVLRSETWLCRGDAAELAAVVRDRFGIVAL